MVIPKVDLGESAVMMGYKLTSQLAMLSILLTFTHSVGHANQVSQALPAAIEAQATLEKTEEPLQAETDITVQAVEELRETVASSGKSSSKRKSLGKSYSSLVPSKRAVFSYITRGFSGSRDQRLVAKKGKNVQGQKPRKGFRSKKERIDCLCNDHKEDKQNLLRGEQTEELCPKAAAVAAARASLSPEEKLQLIREWLAEEKTARRSGRAACKVSEKIKRDGRITSTLRYDAEKALATRVKRNENSVSPKARQRASQRTKKIVEEKAAKGDKAKTSETAPKRESSQEREHTAPENYFAATTSANNTNIASYLNARQYRCDSSGTDWPCSSCVAKRRANFGISVCTMVVTVIAMIVGAVIISNASDSTVAGSGSTGGTGGGGSTQP